jgi:hypothetical protein
MFPKAHLHPVIFEEIYIKEQADEDSNIEANQDEDAKGKRLPPQSGQTKSLNFDTFKGRNSRFFIFF